MTATIVTPNGRYVAFSTGAALSLSPFDDNDQYDVYVMDTTDSSLAYVSRGNSGQVGYGGFFDGAISPSMSHDGRYVVFRSSFSNLVATELHAVDQLPPAIDVGSDCLENEDCDEDAGDGRCTKPIFELNPPLVTTNQCSDYADFVVPVKETRPGVDR